MSARMSAIEGISGLVLLDLSLVVHDSTRTCCREGAKPSSHPLHCMVTIQVVTAARAARPSKEMPESNTVKERPALFPNRARTLTITSAERAVTVASKKE